MWGGSKTAIFARPCETRRKHWNKGLILLLSVFLFDVGIHRTDVWNLGSATVEYLYNWTLTCLSLIELAKKLQSSHAMASHSSGLLRHSAVQTRQIPEISENINQSTSFT